MCHAADDFKLFAERELPLELRSEAGALANIAGSVEAIRVRVLVRGLQPDLEAVRVCISQMHCAKCCESAEELKVFIVAVPWELQAYVLCKDWTCH